MEVIEGELRWVGHRLSSLFKQLRLIAISDVHYGNRFFSMKHFDRTINFILVHDDARCVLTGDMCESTLRSSKGDIYKQVGTPQDQRDWIIERMLPIKDKILGVVTGNHEQRIYNETGIDISKDIAGALGVPYRQEGLLLKIFLGSGNKRIPDKQFVFSSYHTHGYGGARTKGGKSVKIERTSTFVDADFYTMSHDHDVNVAPGIYLMADNRGTIDKETGFLTGKITAKRKMLIKTNAYLKWGGYSEIGGFSPTDLTTPMIMLLTPEAEFWSNLSDRPEKAVRVIA